MRILVVEDTKHLAEAVSHILKKSGAEVDVADDGATGLEYARSDIYDCIVLDNMLPRLSGVEVIQALRKDKITVPIIILSAKSETEDRVEGLDAGADDYLVKPFKVSELLARIRALTRRSRPKLETPETVVGNLTLHPSSAEISTAQAKVNLTAKEFLLLEQLAGQENKIVSKESLFYRAWGHEMFSEDKYVEVYISYIRRKLRAVSANLKIESRRGLGYRLSVEK